MGQLQRSRSSKYYRSMPYSPVRNRTGSSTFLSETTAFSKVHLQSPQLSNSNKQQTVRHWNSQSSKEYLPSREPNSSLRWNNTIFSMLSRTRRCSRCSNSLLASTSISQHRRLNRAMVTDRAALVFTSLTRRMRHRLRHLGLRTVNPQTSTHQANS